MASDMLSRPKHEFDCLSQSEISQHELCKAYSDALERHHKPQFDCLSQSEISKPEISKHEDNCSKDDYTPCLYVPSPIEAALIEDDLDTFATLIKSLDIDEDEDEQDLEYKIFDAYSDMLSSDSIKCFTAMLSGDLAPILDTNYLLAEEDNIPLHGAARLSRCPKITAFLIDQGFSPDLRIDFSSKDVCLKHALPLNVALETYCVFHWPGGSAIHFFTSFLEGPLKAFETIAILARNTGEIKHEFSNYLKQGKMVEVGILLAVARDCILSSSTPEGKDDISFKDISEMHKSLSAEIEKLSVDSTTSQSQCKTQLLEMKNTLQLLDIFDKIGDKFIALSQTTQNSTSEVESLIKDAGFDVDALKTNSEFRRSVLLQVADRGLLPSSFDEQEFCDQVANYGLSSDIKIPGPYFVSVLPSRISVIIGKTRIPGIVGFDEV